MVSVLWIHVRVFPWEESLLLKNCNLSLKANLAVSMHTRICTTLCINEMKSLWYEDIHMDCKVFLPTLRNYKARGTSKTFFIYSVSLEVELVKAQEKKWELSTLERLNLLKKERAAVTFVTCHFHIFIWILSENSKCFISAFSEQSF